MAKDPAFLFYPGDWMGGTMTLTRHQKGCYIDLLIAQFNNGPLALKTIKALLGQDQAVWPVLSKKFKQDTNGNFFNVRLAIEIEKRKKFSASRRNNINKRYEKSTSVTTSVEHMNVHMENKNENEEDRLIEGGAGGRKREEETTTGFPDGNDTKRPSVEDTGKVDLVLPLEKAEIESTKTFVRLLTKKSLTTKEIEDYYSAFRIRQTASNRQYENIGDMILHFQNWIKQQASNGKKTNANRKSDGLNLAATALREDIAILASAGQGVYPAQVFGTGD